MKLETYYVAKPWGRFDLPAPFGPQSEKTGEIWFASPDDASPLALMVKYIFTSEKLSIQVHPSDEQASAKGLSGGKEECWLVLDAGPDAVLGIGTIEALDSARLRAAALSGEIEALMDWKPVKRGDFFYIPAGTVHAIGGDVSLIEVQQNADITYRLYDYGRPRELHLDDGVAVSVARPYPQNLHRHCDFDVDQLLVDGPLFRVALCGAAVPELDGQGPFYAVPLTGSVDDAMPGECLITDRPDALAIAPGSRLLLARAC